MTLRVGTTSAPTSVGCAYCGREIPSETEFYVIEQQPIHQKAIDEFSITCDPCYVAIKEAAIKHKVPIEWDIELPFGTRAAVNMKLIER